MEGFKEITKAVLKTIALIVAYAAALSIPKVVTGVVSFNESPWRYCIGSLGIPILYILFAPAIFSWNRKGYAVPVFFALLGTNALLVQATGIIGVLTTSLFISVGGLILWIFCPALVTAICLGYAWKFYNQVKSGQVVGFDDVIGYPTKIKAEDVAVVCYDDERLMDPPPMPADDDEDEPAR